MHDSEPIESPEAISASLGSVLEPDSAPESTAEPAAEPAVKLEAELEDEFIREIGSDEPEPASESDLLQANSEPVARPARPVKKIGLGKNVEKEREARLEGKREEKRKRRRLRAKVAKIKMQGMRAIDRRSAGGRDVLHYRRDLISALGGEQNISPQRGHILEMAIRARAMLDVIDHWIWSQKSFVTKGALHPIVVQRQSIAKHFLDCLRELGLDRRAVDANTIEDLIAIEQAKQANGN
jgi:hypothetical protein